MQCPARGFTLFELLITCTLIAIITGTAVPLYEGMTARNRQRVEINALFNALYLARRESILRRHVVSICPSADLRSCGTARDWSNGWLMFENSDRDYPPDIDADELVLRRHQVTENIEIAANRRAFTMRATYLRATNGTIVVCDRRQRIAPKALVVSYTGRPRVAVRSSGGEPYSCAR